MKQVPHGHSNLGKGIRVEAQASEQVGEENKTWFNQITRKPSSNAGFGII